MRMVQKTIEYVWRFADRRRDRSGMERIVAAGDMRVEDEARIDAVFYCATIWMRKRVNQDEKL